MLALTWDDVDFDKKTINVNKTIVIIYICNFFTIINPFSEINNSPAFLIQNASGLQSKIQRFFAPF